jgi:radical SAM superfamily enzyme YgiQ (UPF0313 family)
MARYLLSSYVLKAYVDKFFERNKSISIQVLNFSAEAEPSKICEEIIKHDPDYVGYSCYIWNIEKILDIVKSLKKVSNYIHILGGPEISLDRIHRLSDPALADYYVIGEGEKKLANLLSYLKNKSTVSEAGIPKGVAYWNKDKINYNQDTDTITDLDEIPSVYLNGALDAHLYTLQQAFLETQRGCKYKCKYCVYHKNLPLISYYSLQRVFKELDYLITKKRIRALRIFDAVFPSDLTRAKKIVRYLIKIKENNSIRLPWIYWEFNYYDVDEEFIKLITSLKSREKILNTNEILPLDRPQLYSDISKDYTAINCVGVQSFCKQVLKTIGRASIDIEELKNFMNMAKKYNIVLKIDLILGLPLETFNTYFEGLEFFLPFFKDTDHILNIHRLQVLPGTDLEGICGNYGIKYSMKAPHIVFSTQDLSEKAMNYASKLNAVLFRVLNSPLRRYFFDIREKTGKSFYKLIEDIFNKVTAAQEFKKSQLLQNEHVDDAYWNNDIFREIPSDWLTDVLKTN